MSEQNKLQDMIRTSLESLRALVDANTVVGTPINTPSGTTVIPISKVSVGYASGGSEFGKSANAKGFAGGGGTGLSVSPVCFLCVAADGSVELLPVTTAPADPIVITSYNGGGEEFTKANETNQIEYIRKNVNTGLPYEG